VLKEGEGFVVLFLEHHKRKGMNQERGRRKNNKLTKRNQHQKPNAIL
jgi:hypothetical protein